MGSICLLTKFRFRFLPNLVNSGSGSGQISIPVDLWDTHNIHWAINRELNAEQENCIRMMLNKHSEVFAHNPRAPRECSATFHSIRSKHNKPTKSKILRIPQKWVSDVDTQVAEMIKNGIIKESASPYNSNIILKMMGLNDLLLITES